MDEARTTVLARIRDALGIHGDNLCDAQRDRWLAPVDLEKVTPPKPGERESK